MINNNILEKLLIYDINAQILHYRTILFILELLQQESDIKADTFGAWQDFSELDY